MPNQYTANIQITAQDKASGSIDRIARKFNPLNKKARKFDKNMSKADSTIRKSGGSISKMTKKLGALGAIAATAFAGFKLGKQFLNTAVEFENLGVQLKFITGNAKDGAKALSIVEKAAGKSTHSMKEMALATPSLLTVSSVDELASTLDMAGDIASATGMSFQDVASQLQRTFSGGIGAADMFREKGVKSMLGFQEGVQYTAAESEKMIRDAFKNGTTTLKGASSEMAKTWAGQMSMMGDKWDAFQRNTMSGGLFPTLKQNLTKVNTFFDKNKESIDAMAKAIGSGLGSAVNWMIANLFPAVKTIAGLFADLVKIIAPLAKELFPAIWKALWPIRLAFKVIAFALKNIVLPVFKVFIDIITKVVEVMNDVADAVIKVVNLMTGPFKAVGNFIAGLFGGNTSDVNVDKTLTSKNIVEKIVDTEVPNNTFNKNGKKGELKTTSLAVPTNLTVNVARLNVDGADPVGSQRALEQLIKGVASQTAVDVIIQNQKFGGIYA